MSWNFVSNVDKWHFFERFLIFYLSLDFQNECRHDYVNKNPCPYLNLKMPINRLIWYLCLHVPLVVVCFLHISGTIPASYMRTTGVNHKTTKRTNEMKNTKNEQTHTEKWRDDEIIEIILLISRKWF